MIRWLANRTMLAPTRHEIETTGKRRELIPFRSGHVEAWRQASPSCNDSTAPQVVVIKFVGMGGRAERATLHPLDRWSGIVGEVWALNPPGYGRSSGDATVESLPRFADVCWHAIRAHYPTQKIVVCGNSLGCTLALYLAARFKPDALLLRNPPPIGDLIRERARYNWWNFGAAKLVAGVFPKELDAIENAQNCQMPALFVQSELDQVVPTTFQNRIIQAYSGPTKTFVVSGANHNQLLDKDKHETQYIQDLDWLKSQVLGPRID